MQNDKVFVVKSRSAIMGYLGRRVGWLEATFVFRGARPFVLPSFGVVLWARSR